MDSRRRRALKPPSGPPDAKKPSPDKKRQKSPTRPVSSSLPQEGSGSSQFSGTKKASSSVPQRPQTETQPPTPSSSSQSSGTSAFGSRAIISRARLAFDSMMKQINPKPKKLLPYEKTDHSVILFEPTKNVFDLDSNPNGVVRVIVHEHFTSTPGKRLTPEQIQGLEFLWKWVAREKKGCILGHGMGMGKTLTALVLLFTLLEQREGAEGQMEPTIKKALIVTPKSILHVWQKQIAEWSPEKLKLDHVTVTSAMKVVEQEKHILEFETNSVQVMLLSYDSFKKHYQLFQKYKQPIDLAILDEAHFVKNAKAQRTEVFGPYFRDDGIGHRPTVKIMVGLTGTPYQNNDEELCSLVNFFRPNCLPQDIQEMLNLLEKADRNAKNSEKSTDQIEAAKTQAQRIREGFHKIFQPSIHYRSSGVSGVDKHELIVCVKLQNETQQNMYDEITNLTTFKNMDSFSKIHTLRKICWHPEDACENIKDRQLRKFVEPFKAAIEKEKLLDPTIPNFTDSGKLNFVIRLMCNILFGKDQDQKNDKVVVVSYSIRQLKRVSAFCDFAKWSYVEFTGKESDIKQRENLEKFRSNGEKTQILLLSSKVGGQGLDLSNANHLILMDPGWTPALDNQIVHRIYRKGQTKDCFVYRVLATNTIEEVMFLNQLGKYELAQYYEDNDPKKKPKSAYDPKDLSIFHNSESGSFLKDMIYKVNSDTAADDESIERKFFAHELMKSKQYTSVEGVPDKLKDLKETWKEGVSFVFHKFMGDDGANVYRTIEEELVISDSSIEGSHSSQSLSGSSLEHGVQK